MYNSVSELEMDVMREIEAGDLDRALTLIIRFVGAVVVDRRATATVFGSRTLDLLCLKIGIEVLGAGRLNDIKTDDRREPMIIYIATGLFKRGGHTAVIEDLIKAQPEKSHRILVTNLHDSAEGISGKDRFVPLKVPVEIAPEGSPLKKLQWLQQAIMEIRPTHIYLFHNYHDAVAVAAAQPCFTENIIFYHHADHHLCLGMYLPDVLHVDPHNIGYFHCRNQLGIVNNRYWPLVVEDLGTRPIRLPFMDDGTLRTCSSGHKSKFEEPYLYVYAEEVPKFLEITQGVHVHIGELSSNTLETIYEGMAKRGIGKDRLTYIPWLQSLWTAMFEHRIDFYISSFPLGGGRAAIEVMGSGTPMAMHDSYLSRFHGGIDIAYPEVFTWRKPSDLYHYLRNLTPELLTTQSRFARKHYERHHTPGRLKQEIAKYETGMEALEPIPLKNHIQDGLQIFLDQAKYDQASFNQLSRLKQLISFRDEQIRQQEQRINQLAAGVSAQMTEPKPIFGTRGWTFFKKIDQIKNRVLSHFKRTSDKEHPKDFPYNLWISKYEPAASQIIGMKRETHAWSCRPKISIVTPVCDPDKYALMQCIDSVMDQIYENWELCLVNGGSDKAYVQKIIQRYAREDSRIKFRVIPENLGIAGNSNEALKLATGDYVAFLDHDDTLAPFALYEGVKLLNQDTALDLVYSDEDKISPTSEKRNDPFFKPDWSPDTFLSYNYLCHLTVIRKALVDKVGGFREGYDGAQDYDLLLRIVQNTNKIKRIPKILYHRRETPGFDASESLAKPQALVSAKKAIREYLNAKGWDGEVVDGLFPTSYRVKYKVRPDQKISIIIPTRDKVSLLRSCVTSILEKTDFERYEILIIDNQSREEETFAYFDIIERDPRIRILQYGIPFNFSLINNFGVRSTNSEYLLFLNNDTEVINREWLSALLEFAQRDDVGAVGAKLFYPNDTIQHAGVILGIGGMAHHPHLGFQRTSHGYYGRINVVQNMSAVTGACMMVRRDVFERVGGFDERLSHAYNDVDLCLKIREKGYLIVYTPYAELYHHESASRGYEDTPERQARLFKEMEIVRTKWKHLFEQCDPYYNPNLTHDKLDFSIRM